ncbi:CKLF-like MARVEL transmembrane domain-containing protein 6 [Pogona vitticeps]|uniref:CKLF-like MARVEL transmembrane domain-containing protein 6 n=1 Tax=Pogona vitticeps TaxID=103695 RepID=A0A6J0UAD9_9SAUR
MENGDQVYVGTTVPAGATPGKGPFWRSCSIGHLGLLRFSLKVSQLVLSFLAFVLEEVVSQCTRCSGLYFFEFVSCSAFLLCIPILFICCTSFYERIGKEKVNKLDTWILISVGAFFLLASIVFSATSDKTSVETAAFVFGYFASFAFLLDAGLLVYKLCKAKEERQPENTGNALNAIENQPLNNQQA